jgi:putative photosynthetic complex assembly protein 2
VTGILAPLAFAALAWWVSTGIVLWLSRRPASTFPVTLAASGLAACAALAALFILRDATAPSAAYGAFAAAIVVWGFIELTFLTGWIVGPATATPLARSGWKLFAAGARALLHHEIVLIAGAVLVLGLSWSDPNPVGAWTYLLLWGMRTSAKLNLFLGVPNPGAELLPPQLEGLKPFLRRRAMNALLPVSIAAGCVVVALLVRAALEPAVPDSRATGLLLVGALAALAVLEHAMLLLPLPADAFWRFRARKEGSGARP